MPFVQEAFGTLGDTVVLDGRSIGPRDVRDAVMLAIRSTTRVNRDLLAGSSVEFVGTATIGTDHLDKAYLDERGIRWCYSPGCNANSVSEYIAAALLTLAARRRFALQGKTIGVVGVGNVGRRVVEKAQALGLRVLRNDPPRERAERPTDEFVALDQVLAEADILSMHVPITNQGDDPTYHMVDGNFFSRAKRGIIFINAARGPVVETDSLISALEAGIVSHAVIDTWEGEPDFRRDLLDRADIATPHIAGHSFEGKVMGTVMVYREACRFLNVEPAWSPEPLLPEPLVPHITLDAAGRREADVLQEVVNAVYDIEADDRQLRSCCSDHAAHFDTLRKNYPIRREFRFTRVTAENAAPGLKAKIAGLGFQISP